MTLPRRPPCRRSCCPSPKGDDAVAAVAQGGRAGGVGADEVALTTIAGKGLSRIGIDWIPLPALPEMTLPAPAVVPPIVLLVALVDQIPAGRGWRWQTCPAALVPMKLPCDHVAGRAGAGDPDAVAAVAGDDVAGPGGRAADRVVVTCVHLDAVVGVGQGGGAGGVGADRSCPATRLPVAGCR